MSDYFWLCCSRSTEFVGCKASLKRRVEAQCEKVKGQQKQGPKVWVNKEKTTFARQASGRAVTV